MAGNHSDVMSKRLILPVPYNHTIRQYSHTIIKSIDNNLNDLSINFYDLNYDPNYNPIRFNQCDHICHNVYDSNIISKTYKQNVMLMPYNHLVITKCHVKATLANKRMTKMSCYNKQYEQSDVRHPVHILNKTLILIKFC